MSKLREIWQELVKAVRCTMKHRRQWEKLEHGWVWCDVCQEAWRGDENGVTR